jgi:putative secretion ATPase (PEP-CTERM system associated)
MYEKYYGFREKPFALRPDARFLYLARHHVRALLLMEYGILNEASFLLITGEIGSGKTTLIRCLLERMESTLTVGLLSNTSRESGRLLQWIGLAFGLDVRGKEDVVLYDELMHFVIDLYAQGQRAVLIVDEAQNLGRARLEELRLLSNLNSDQDFLLQMMLVGQPELRDLMRTPQLRQLAQRIGADYHIGGLAQEETFKYVAHRLEVAGGKPDLFTDEAVELAHSCSRGIPRLINQLCDTALVYGYAAQRSTIDLELMEEVVRDRLAGGIFPGRRPAPKPVPEPVPQARNGSRDGL